MAKSGRQRSSKPAPSASGGPAANRGHDYQINCAVFWSLGLILKYFADPQKSWAIALEPRSVHGQAVSRWDILITPDTILWEAKLNPVGSDIKEWLNRIRVTEDPGCIFGLAYSTGHTSRVNAIKRLKDLAVECEGDQSKFEALLKEDEEGVRICGELGPQAFNHLQRVQLEQIPENLLRQNMLFRSSTLAGSEASKLVDFLFRTLSEGATERRRYEIHDLTERCRSAGISLTPPGDIALSQIPPLAQNAMIILKTCPHGAPITVLADALGTSPENLEGELEDLTSGKIVATQGETLRLAAWSHPVPADAEDGILTRFFDLLLSWLERNELSRSAVGQLHNAMGIAPRCLRRRPGLALKFFQATEHTIKNLGDKHLLLQMSEICVAAAKSPSPEDKDLKTKAMAQAYMCGHSWVFQRTGRLPEAKLFAEKSLRLGEQIGWKRNTAFAKKCMARIDRLEAEEKRSLGDRATLLTESERKFRQAIALFSELDEFGPNDRQVGDCLSLLARTLLVAGNFTSATQSIQSAYEILPETPTKEYMDLLILTGDLGIATGNSTFAAAPYDQVIEWGEQDNRELSEIRARAFMRRGSNRLKVGHADSAKPDFESAASIWRSLDEPHLAAEAEWELLKLEGKIESRTLGMFEVESRLVALTAVRGYLDRLSATRAHARRAQPTRSQVEQMLKEAQKRVSEDYREW